MNPAELRPFAATECYPTPFSLEFTAHPFIIWQRQEKSKVSPEGNCLLRVRPDAVCGCSSVVERHVANVAVVGSSPITRSLRPRRPGELRIRQVRWARRSRLS